ncbi:hypothetical protein [Salinispora vitiensis]|uniref:hypothetical protein n=1 Tax=Salinispora vitiensis TaxID=999544 RepID=UPI000374BC40|nr:hypothetical protein [Salinispora vitiensis]
MTTADDRPYRLVTEHGEAWMLTTGGEYTDRTHSRHRSLDALHAEHTVRPVLPVTEQDHQLLQEALRRAGRRAVASLASALDLVCHELRESLGGQASMQTMIAGRPGSWESAALQEVIWFGATLNRPRLGGNVTQTRAAGPNARVDPAAQQTMAEIIRRWVSDPHRYTEVAETLADIVSQHADEHHGVHGWAEIADDRLQPGPAADENSYTCYKLLYSLSQHLDPALL